MTGSSILLFSTFSFGEGGRSFRYDLESKIPVLCAQSAMNGLQFLQLGIFDSQVKALLLPRNVDRSSGKIAREVENFYGEISGSCDEKQTLVLYTRAPVPVRVQDHKLHVPAKISQLCQSLTLRFAPASSGSSREISQAASVALPHDDGIVSLTCVPKEHPDLGHQTWFWVPTGHGPLENAPYSEILKDESHPESSLQVWIERIRKSEGIASPLLKSKALDDLISHFAEQHSIDHDRKRNKVMQALAFKEGLALIGEDRAQGLTLVELSWLLWNSPRHRDLILSREASFASWVIRKNHGTWFLLLVLAKKKEPFGS